MPTGKFKRTKEHRRKIALAHLGKKRVPFSKEWREKLGNASRGRIPSEEARKKSSKSQTGIKNHNYGKLASKETRKKMSISQKGRKHSKETRKKQSEWHIQNPNKKFKDTGIELKIEKELQNRGVVYEKQKSLCKIAIVDFYLPSLKSVIQCDGCYWHGCPFHYPLLMEKKRDRNQDTVLESSGFKVYRFWEHEINESVENCINRIN